MAIPSEPTVSKPASPGALALNWLALDAWPRLLTTADLHLRWQNVAAERLLAKGTHLRAEAGVLVTADAAHQHELEKLVRAAEPAATLRAFRCQGDRDHFVIQVQSVGDGGGLPAIGLQVRPLREEFGDRNFDHLRHLFRLTKAEYAVLLEMLRGNTADEISRHRASSVETVRTQIRQIYTKVGVSSRERLFRTVRPVLFL